MYFSRDRYLKERYRSLEKYISYSLIACLNMGLQQGTRQQSSICTNVFQYKFNHFHKIIGVDTLAIVTR